MALPSTGPISLNQVNVELGRSGTATISLNETAVRNLAGKPSGTISMADLRGKSAYTAPSGLSGLFIFGDSFAGVCTTVSGSTNVTWSNGEAPFTVTFTRTSGQATPAGTTTYTNVTTRSRSFTVSQFLCPGGEVSGSYSVTVTDNQNNSVSGTLNYNLINYGGF